MGIGYVKMLFGCSSVCSLCLPQCYVFLHRSNHTEIRPEESSFPCFIREGKSWLLSATHQLVCAWDTCPFQGSGAATVVAGVGTLAVLL